MGREAAGAIAETLLSGDITYRTQRDLVSNSHWSAHIAIQQEQSVSKKVNNITYFKSCGIYQGKNIPSTQGKEYAKNEKYPNHYEERNQLIKGISIGKEKVKLSIDNMIAYAENRMESTKHWQELIKFSKIIG